MCRYPNGADYFGGLEPEGLNQLFHAMHLNFKAWVSGFAPLAVGADIDSMAVQEFSRSLFNIRPDVAFSVAKTIFTSDLRSILHQVRPVTPTLGSDLGRFGFFAILWPWFEWFTS